MNKLPPQKHFLVIEDQKTRCTLSLESETCSIGRDPHNLIVLNSPKISRYHATLLRITLPGTDSYQFRIIDGDLKGRRSRNGFKVNGNVCFSYDLQPGDVITFCEDITATYRAVEEPKIYKAAEPTFVLEDDEDVDATCFLGNIDNSTGQSRSHQTLNISEEERQASIQQSLERLASFPELFSDPIIEIDLQGNITYLNPAALKRFPKLKKDKLQHPILDKIIPLVKAKEEASFVREVKIEGRIFEQSIHLISASKLVRCYISDITERKQAEILLKKAHQELEKRVEQRTLELAYNNEILKAEIAEREQIEQEIRLLQTITQAIAKASNFNDAIAITLRKVCETINWSFGEAWIPDEQENMLQLSPSYYSSTEKYSIEKLGCFRESSQKFNFSSQVGIPGRVWSTKKFEWIEDVTQLPNKLFLRNKMAQEVGLKTALGVPIIADEKVIAVFIFFDFSARTENQEIIELVNSVGSQLGLFMERKQAEDALRSSMATNRAILHAIPDLIFRITREGVFVNFKNAKVKNLLIPEEKFVGKHIYEVFPKEIALSTMNCVEKAFNTGEVQVLECEIPASDKIYSYEVRIAVSEINEVMAIVRDITDRKQVEKDIRRTLEQEKKLNELKSQFVTMASHEFRTPLASILSSAELLEHYSHKWTEEKKLNHLQRIQASVKHMTELLNDVLLLGKAEAGKLELNPSQINLVQFCQELVEEIQLTTQTHQIILQIETCTEADDSCIQQSGTTKNNCSTVCMDEKMLRHILNNLLSNAIKYSPNHDKVVFDLICQSQQAVFRIQDFGIGVPVEEQKQLFDSFHRATNVGSISGTGLGLAIVKRSVDLHGGTILMSSQVNLGTTFTATLPYLVSE
jgi:signal transduction histidine kinase/pSer/pThr/pTyr-binding forkhead associated (FHA) protein